MALRKSILMTENTINVSLRFVIWVKLVVWVIFIDDNKISRWFENW